jgi:hypothetical protein
MNPKMGFQTAMNKFAKGSVHTVSHGGYYTPKGPFKAQVISSGLTTNKSFRCDENGKPTIHQLVLNVKFRALENEQEFTLPYNIDYI